MEIFKSIALIVAFIILSADCERQTENGKASKKYETNDSHQITFFRYTAISFCNQIRKNQNLPKLIYNMYFERMARKVLKKNREFITDDVDFENILDKGSKNLSLDVWNIFSNISHYTHFLKRILEPEVKYIGCNYRYLPNSEIKFACIFDKLYKTKENILKMLNNLRHESDLTPLIRDKKIETMIKNTLRTSKNNGIKFSNMDFPYLGFVKISVLKYNILRYQKDKPNLNKIFNPEAKYVGCDYQPPINFQQDSKKTVFCIFKREDSITNYIVDNCNEIRNKANTNLKPVVSTKMLESVAKRVLNDYFNYGQIFTKEEYLDTGILLIVIKRQRELSLDINYSFERIFSDNPYNLDLNTILEPAARYIGCDYTPRNYFNRSNTTYVLCIFFKESIKNYLIYHFNLLRNEKGLSDLVPNQTLENSAKETLKNGLQKGTVFETKHFPDTGLLYFTLQTWESVYFEKTFYDKKLSLFLNQILNPKAKYMGCDYQSPVNFQQDSSTTVFCIFGSEYNIDNIVDNCNKIRNKADTNLKSVVSTKTLENFAKRVLNDYFNYGELLFTEEKYPDARILFVVIERARELSLDINYSFERIYNDEGYNLYLNRILEPAARYVGCDVRTKNYFMGPDNTFVLCIFYKEYYSIKNYLIYHFNLLRNEKGLSDLVPSKTFERSAKEALKNGLQKGTVFVTENHPETGFLNFTLQTRESVSFEKTFYDKKLSLFLNQILIPEAKYVGCNYQSAKDIKHATTMTVLCVFDKDPQFDFGYIPEKDLRKAFPEREFE